MGDFTYAEKADMHYMYGRANGNGRAALRMYRAEYPDRRMPDHRIFQRLHRQLCETGAFDVNRHDAGRLRAVRTPRLEASILDIVADRPESSTRTVARDVGVSHQTVCRVLNENRLHPFHFQKVQALNPADYPLRVNFCQWVMQQCALQPDFVGDVLFTDEATLSREGVFNAHNSHVWATDNPHATRPHAFQQRFCINVWAGIVNDFLIGPYLLPTRLSGGSYLIFLKEVLPQLLHDVPIAIRNRMWFQHDGAPAHFSIDVRNYLNITFGARWIGRGGPIPWPPRSSDLSNLDYFLWGHLKHLVYETPVDSDEDLVARISVAAAGVRETPGIFERVRQSLHRRCQACIASGGRNFEHLL